MGCNVSTSSHPNVLTAFDHRCQRYQVVTMVTHVCLKNTPHWFVAWAEVIRWVWVFTLLWKKLWHFLKATLELFRLNWNLPECDYTNSFRTWLLNPGHYLQFPGQPHGVALIPVSPAHSCHMTFALNCPGLAQARTDNQDTVGLCTISVFPTSASYQRVLISSAVWHTGNPPVEAGVDVPSRLQNPRTGN